MASPSTVQAPPIEPDTKDWTWVLEQPCPDCGLDPATVDRVELGRLMRDNATAWTAALTAPRVTERPRPDVWSVTEYACHVRDVHVLFAQRLALMLAETNPEFANWDQDVAAVESRYDLADPAAVSPQLVDAAEAVAAAYDAVSDDDWSRPGRRSNGDAFTIESFGRYHLHDVVHHLWDVAGAVTVGGYGQQAAAYRAAGQPMSDNVRVAVDELVAALPAGSRVLEIGSGAGRDAAALEAGGLSVRRTDITPGFVELLRADGFDADVLDPLTDDLADPARPEQPYDAVWASASLLHVARADLPVVLRRLADATRAEGLLQMSVKEGDGDGWSTHGSIPTPRRFVYWREQPLREVLAESGWQELETNRGDGLRGESWLRVLAVRR
jgi:SAM-dependent methyltransferase